MAFSAAPGGGQRISISGPSVTHRLSASGEALRPPVYGTTPAGGQAVTVVPASMHDGTMNTASAEHQKTRITAAGDAVEFSSPFAFSQADGEQAAPQSVPPAPIPPARLSMTTTQIYQEFPVVTQMAAPTISATHSVPQSSFGIGQPTNFGQQQSPGVVVQHVIIAQQQPPPQPQVIYQQVPMQMQQPPPVKALPPGVPVLEGWLAKRGEDFGQPWLERWFVLHQNGTLSYRHKKESKEEKNIDLGPHVRVRPITHPEATGQGKVQAAKKPFGFEICPGTTGRTYYIDAGSMEKRDIWCRALNDAIMQKQGAPGGYGGGMNYGYNGYR